MEQGRVTQLARLKTRAVSKESDRGGWGEYAKGRLVSSCSNPAQEK